MVLIALLSLQVVAANATSPLGTWKETNEEVIDQVFECMDANIKVHLKAEFSHATPASIVDKALAACAHLKGNLSEVAASPSDGISTSAGQELTEGFFQQVRGTYLRQVDTMLSAPAFAEARMNLIIGQWGGCVRVKASDWSRLSDEASTVARAVLSACHDHEANLQGAAFGGRLRTFGMRSGWTALQVTSRTPLDAEAHGHFHAGTS